MTKSQILILSSRTNSKTSKKTWLIEFKAGDLSHGTEFPSLESVLFTELLRFSGSTNPLLAFYVNY